MSEFNSHLQVKQSSEKSFGVVFSVVFLVIGLLPLIDGGGLRLWSLAVAVVLLLFAYVWPDVLARPNQFWCKLGLLLGAVVAPITMGIIYFLAVLPTGLLVRLSGKDLLRLKIDRQAKSYWIPRDQPVGSMKNQF